jgi:hypothetical protein
LSDDSPEQPPYPANTEEARVRRALGLGSGTPRRDASQQRERGTGARRFARDGEVPVVMLRSSDSSGGAGNGPSNRLVAAEAALRTEKAARDAAERSLKEATATVQSLQTKLAHAELAHAEALAAEHDLRLAAEAALEAAMAPPPPAEQNEADFEPAAAQHLAHAPEVTSAAPEPSSVPRRRKVRVAVAVDDAPEPEPVQWWLPTYRSKSRRR